jgi:hypothetical protein
VNPDEIMAEVRRSLSVRFVMFVYRRQGAGWTADAENESELISSGLQLTPERALEVCRESVARYYPHATVLTFESEEEAKR